MASGDFGEFRKPNFGLGNLRRSREKVVPVGFGRLRSASDGCEGLRRANYRNMEITSHRCVKKCPLMVAGGREGLLKSNFGLGNLGPCRKKVAPLGCGWLRGVSEFRFPE